MSVDLNTVFGDEHSWDELRSILVKHLRKRFRGAPEEDIQDAASDGILDLCDYWAGLKSSMTADVSRNWHYAKWRATRRAASRLYRTVMEDAEVDSLDRVVRPANGDDREVTLGDLVAQREVAAPELTDEEYQERVSRFIAAIPEDDLEEWLHPMMHGETVRAQAARTGRGRMAVHRKRVSGKARLSVLAQSYGLRVA